MTDKDLDLLDRAINQPWHELIRLASKAETKMCRDILLDDAYRTLKREEQYSPV